MALESDYNLSLLSTLGTPADLSRTDSLLDDVMSTILVGSTLQ